MITPDLSQVIEKYITDTDEWRKGKLHPSSDLNGCLRKTALELRGVEGIERPLADQSRLHVGRIVHASFQNWLITQKKLVGVEVEVGPGLGEHWSGSVDLLFHLPKDKAWAIVDVKTMASEQIYYGLENGTLGGEDHTWQLSAYAYALSKQGRPVKYASILVWPIDSGFKTPVSGYKDKKRYSPFQVNIELLSHDVVEARLRQVESTLSAELEGKTAGVPLPTFLPTVEKVSRTGTKKNPKAWHVYRQQPWQCDYCQFKEKGCLPPPRDLMGIWHCAEGGWWNYEPEAGHENYKPDFVPDGHETSWN